MPRKKSSTIESAGVRVRVFRRGARFWLDVRAGSARKRVSADTTDRSLAESKAAQLARAIATQQLTGVTPETLTLGQVFSAYADTKRANLKPSWRRAAETRANLFLAAWGEALPVAQISQTSVDAYCAARRARRVTTAVAAKRIEAGLAVTPLRDGALDSDFRWLSSVFNWATSHKLATGRRLLDRNPLHDAAWPREKNLLRPIASDDRYARTLEQVDAVDPHGRLRLILTLAFETGRRESSIIGLRASDVLLSPARIGEALASEGMDEGRASQMPFGALRWRPETEKTNTSSIVAITREARTALDRYLAQHGRIGDAPLFPGPRNDGQPISRVIAYRWLMKAERLAELPKLRRGGWHPYRRLFATANRNAPDSDVMSAAGWRSAKTLAIYQQSDDAGVMAMFASRPRQAEAGVA